MSELIKINLLPTHVIYYGLKHFNIDINFNINSNDSIIVLMITGLQSFSQLIYY